MRHGERYETAGDSGLSRALMLIYFQLASSSSQLKLRRNQPALLLTNAEIKHTYQFSIFLFCLFKNGKFSPASRTMFGGERGCMRWRRAIGKNFCDAP